MYAKIHIHSVLCTRMQHIKLFNVYKHTITNQLETQFMAHIDADNSSDMFYEFVLEEENHKR